MRTKVFVLAGLMAFAIAVSSFAQTKSAAYPEMYGDNAGSTILIMPPINTTNEVEAKEYFYYTMNTELSSRGWYVYPPVLALRTLQEESANDSELFVDADISKFGEIFGADYLMFTTIEQWYKSTVAKTLQVIATYNLRSTKTGKTVFSRKCSYTYSLADVDSAASNLASMNTGNAIIDLIGAVSALGIMAGTAVATAKTGTMDVARYCNLYAFQDIPYGPLHGHQGEDANDNAKPYYIMQQ